MQRRIAVNRRLLRRHDAVRQGIDAGDRHGKRLRLAQVLRAQVRDMRRRAHRVRDQAVERLHQRRRLASGGIEGDRAAQRHHRADALRRLVGAVHGEHAAQAPPDEAHPAAAAVVQVADLLLEGAGVPAAEADVAAEAPGLHLVAPVLEEELERDQGHLVRHEPRKQQHGMAVAPRRPGEDRQVGWQRDQFEQHPRLDELVEQVRPADVRVSLGHAAWASGFHRPREVFPHRSAMANTLSGTVSGKCPEESQGPPRGSNL